MYEGWLYDQGMARDYPAKLVASKIRDIDGVNVDARHRFGGGGEPARCYKFDLPMLREFLGEVFKN